ncbi:hypothetical protein L0Y47_21550 [Ectopseudomonas composti]
MYHYCRECRRALEKADQHQGLCPEHSFLADDWHRFDILREEGHSTYAAKLMAGLADPPDPDDD